MKAKMPVHGAVPVAILLDQEITLADLKVYTALSSFQGSNDDSYPSREKIVERCGLVVETVSRSVKHLMALGWIQRDRRGLNQTNVYRVMIEVVATPGSDLQVTSKNDLLITPDMTNKSFPSIEQKEQKKRREKEVRHKHGEYQHVLLTDSELTRFKTDFPLDWEQRIKSCDEYCQQYGRKYSDYNLTMRKWARKDLEKQTPLFDAPMSKELTEQELRFRDVARRG